MSFLRGEELEIIELWVWVYVRSSRDKKIVKISMQVTELRELILFSFNFAPLKISCQKGKVPVYFQEGHKIVIIIFFLFPRSEKLSYSPQEEVTEFCFAKDTLQ